MEEVNTYQALYELMCDTLSAAELEKNGDKMLIVCGMSEFIRKFEAKYKIIEKMEA